MTKVLITGMSGVGKSSALAELARRGYAVVDTDYSGFTEWVEDRIEDLLRGADDDATLFVAGAVRNQGTFYPWFDAIVLLSAPAHVMLQRLETRTTNDYGKTPAERDVVLDDLARWESPIRDGATHEIDTSTRPLDEVVAELIEIARDPRAASSAIPR